MLVLACPRQFCSLQRPVCAVDWPLKSHATCCRFDLPPNPNSDYDNLCSQRWRLTRLSVVRCALMLHATVDTIHKSQRRYTQIFQRRRRLSETNRRRCCMPSLRGWQQGWGDGGGKGEHSKGLFVDRVRNYCKVSMRGTANWCLRLPPLTPPLVGHFLPCGSLSNHFEHCGMKRRFCGDNL